MYNVLDLTQHQDIAEILLNLVLSTNQSILRDPISMFMYITSTLCKF